MSLVGKNIKTLRKFKKLSQAELADSLQVKRSTLSAWENEFSEPKILQLTAIADFFKINLDRIIRQNLSDLTQFELKRIEEGYDIDIRGQHLRILATTVTPDNEDNIEVIPESAKAGYTVGYADPEYMENLPLLSLPFLPQDKKYRCFMVEGDSMPPVQAGSYIIGEYLPDWNDIKDGEFYIVITLNDGIVFKMVNNWLAQRQAVQLCSTNPMYAPYEVAAKDILEIWKFKLVIADDIPAPQLKNDQITQTLLQLQQEVDALKRK